MVDVGLTVFDVPVPRLFDHVMVPPEHPLADKVVLPPTVMVDGLALNDGADGAAQPICSKKTEPSSVVSRRYPDGVVIFAGIVNPPHVVSLPRHDLVGAPLVQLRSVRSIKLAPLGKCLSVVVPGAVVTISHCEEPLTVNMRACSE